MKRYKLITFILSLSLMLILNTIGTASYFIYQANSDTVSYTLGNIKIETDNTELNSWRYVPISIVNDINDKNDLVDEAKLSSNLVLNDLRPGDGFEKDITITSLGDLKTKLKIDKGKLLIDSPFNLFIKLKQKDQNLIVNQDTNNKDIWYVENFKKGNKVVFTVRLEVPTAIVNGDLNDSNITLNNELLELFDITATQWNNSGWSQ